jgi:transcriptional regulator with XRE-family HTH domain
MVVSVNDARIAASLRACRRRQRLRQVDVALRSGVRRETVSRLERGFAGRVPLDTLRAVADALGLRLDLGLRWRGGDLDRILNAGHAALHESLAKHLGDLEGWTWLPEVPFSIYGERGVIDVLAWHPATRCLLVIELNTDLVDPQALVSTMRTRVRLARRIARDYGWAPTHVASWVIILDTKTNRRRLAARRAPSDSVPCGWPQDGSLDASACRGDLSALLLVRCVSCTR